MRKGRGYKEEVIKDMERLKFKRRAMDENRSNIKSQARKGGKWRQICQ
jgi:hypothetical protein